MNGIHHNRIGLLVLLLLALATGGSGRAVAQERLGDETGVNSEAEAYLRALQLVGAVELVPWSIRELGPEMVRRLELPEEGHPWAGALPRDRSRGEESGGAGGRAGWSLSRPWASATYNTSFPYGWNDGPVWLGRGATFAAEAGGSAWLGPLTIELHPIVFWTENRDFEMAPNGREGPVRFADHAQATTIDQPRRFGEEGYGRVDPGRSTIRIDLWGVAAGVSTASQHWGPARHFPLILGNNGGGFPHAFVGTSVPLDLWIGSLHARAIVGELDQSDFTPWEGDLARRSAAGLVALFRPRGVDGLEIGATRFFHFPWDGGAGLDEGARLFEDFLKAGLNDEPANQLASAFFRWAFPGSGLEVYGEFAREDHNWDFRDFTLEPDHISAYLLGLGKVWRPHGRRLVVVRAEVANARINHIAEVRPQSPFYGHSQIRQGHTQRGQVLGAFGVNGGGAAALTVEDYHSWGRWGAGWFRILQREFRAARDTPEDSQDVIHALRADGVLRRGRYELGGDLTVALNLNREFREDETNVRLSTWVRMSW